MCHSKCGYVILLRRLSSSGSTIVQLCRTAHYIQWMACSTTECKASGVMFRAFYDTLPFIITSYQGISEITPWKITFLLLYLLQNAFVRTVVALVVIRVVGAPSHLYLILSEMHYLCCSWGITKVYTKCSNRRCYSPVDLRFWKDK